MTVRISILPEVNELQLETYCADVELFRATGTWLPRFMSEMEDHTANSQLFNI